MDNNEADNEFLNVVKAFKTAAKDRGVKGAKLGQLVSFLASMPAEERRTFILPMADDPEALFEYVQIGYNKAQGVASGSRDSASISTAPAVGAPAPTAQQPYVDMAMLKDALAEQTRPLMSNLQEVLADNAARQHHPDWAELRREWARSSAAVPKEKKVLGLCGILVLAASVWLCAWNFGPAIGTAPVALAVVLLLGQRYCRVTVAAAMQVRAAAWASLSARWAGAASASWRAWLMAVIRAVQFAVWAPLWLLVWIPVSTCTGMVSRLDEYWPLSVSLCIFVVRVCHAVSGGALPPADVSAKLLWLVGDIRSLAGIALFSWKSLLVAQERGAWILVNWCKEWMGCATVVA